MVAIGGEAYEDSTRSLRQLLRAPQGELRACQPDFALHQVNLQVGAWFDVMRAEPASVIRERFGCEVPSVKSAAEILKQLCGEVEFTRLAETEYRIAQADEARAQRAAGGCQTQTGGMGGSGSGGATPAGGSQAGGPGQETCCWHLTAELKVKKADGSPYFGCGQGGACLNRHVAIAGLDKAAVQALFDGVVNWKHAPKALVQTAVDAL